MTDAAQLRDIIDQLTTELNETKEELRDTKRKLLQARTNESQKIKDWTRATEDLETEFNAQKDEIEHLENTLNCFLSELTDLTPEMVVDESNESRRREQERDKKKLADVSAELEQYKNMWRVEEKKSEDLEEALFQATIDEDELRAKLEEIELGGTPKSFLKDGQSLEPIEELLLEETKAELETTTDDVIEAKTELATKEKKLQSTNKELQQFQEQLEATIDEKKFLEAKAGPVYRVPIPASKSIGLMVIEDRRIPKNEPGRVRIEYQGDKLWKCSHMDALENLKTVLSKKNEEISKLEQMHFDELNNLEERLEGEQAQNLKTLRESLNLTISETTRLNNECLYNIELLSEENTLLREELEKCQGLIKNVHSDARSIKTAKISISSEEISGKSKRGLMLHKGTCRNKKPPVRLTLQSVTRVGSQIIPSRSKNCGYQVVVSRVI